jgi:2-C-methyl-D-erythritol 4-phosphate cytidylyltransferase
MSKIIGILLAAGKSTRFMHSLCKQLYPIKGQPIIYHSMNPIYSVVNTLILVTNRDVKKILYGNYIEQVYPNIVIVENNNKERKDSLNIAIEYIQLNLNLNKDDKIIIHDVARPFVTKEYYQNIIKIAENNITAQYLQYSLKLTNGLYNVKDKHPVDRNEFIELCTPICMSYDMLILQKTDEIIDSITELNQIPSFIYGDYNILKKITTIEDIPLNNYG